MALTYRSGEQIHHGDRVAYAGYEGTIELVVVGVTGDAENDWLLENHGAGVLVVVPKAFGRVYLHTPHDDEDLLFVARSQDHPPERA